MATIEQVEKLREKANVTYDEAKNALDATGGDLLEAMIYLERQGKVDSPKNGGYYNSKNQTESEKESTNSTYEEKYAQHGETFFQLTGKFFRWCGKIIAKGNKNTFEVWRNNEEVLSMPVTILVLLAILAFWIFIPLIIIGLFFGCRYLFKGPDLGKTGVNRFMDSAADMAENIKKEVKEDNKDHE